MTGKQRGSKCYLLKPRDHFLKYDGCKILSGLCINLRYSTNILVHVYIKSACVEATKLSTQEVVYLEIHISQYKKFPYWIHILNTERVIFWQVINFSFVTKCASSSRFRSQQNYYYSVFVYSDWCKIIKKNKCLLSEKEGLSYQENPSKGCTEKQQIRNEAMWHWHYIEVTAAHSIIIISVNIFTMLLQNLGWDLWEIGPGTQ